MTSRKKNSPNPPGMKPTTRKVTPPKPTSANMFVERKSTPRRPATPPPVPAVPTLVAPHPPTHADEQAFLSAIWNTPDNLTVHLAYADWLTEAGHEVRANVLRAWVEFVRIPFRADTAADVLDALQAYWATLIEWEIRWLEALERLRPWISRPVAEKVVRVCLADVYCPAEAAAWSVEVTRCFFDDRWHGAYRGEVVEKGGYRIRAGAFFVNPLTGRPSGHVTTG